MKNLAVHIVIPKGLALMDGSFLDTDVTLDVVSGLEPYYASIDQVRLAGGMYLRKLSDLTIACQIYDSSVEADLVSPCNVTPDSAIYKRYVGSRNQWVTAKAARVLLQNLLGIIGVEGAHVLANFSVTRTKGLSTEGVATKVDALNKDIALYEPTIRSCGNTVPGGHPQARFAAKGVFDWMEKTPARTWGNTGLGANATSFDFGSPTGGRGKPVKFFSSPFYSPPVINIRSGIYQTGYPILIPRPATNL